MAGLKPRIPILRGFWLPALATLVSVAIAYSIEAKCQGLPRLPVPDVGCGSDISLLYHARGFDRQLIPYVQSFNEYPPLTASFQYAAALTTHSPAGFFDLNIAAMLVLALAVSWMLFAWTEGSARVWIWALGPPLWLYAAHNWDLIAVCLASAGLWMFERKRAGWAGLLLGLGVAAKWYPILPGIVAAALLVREERTLGSKSKRYLAGAVLGAGLPHVPFAFVSPRGLLASYQFHFGRLPNEESLPYALGRLSGVPSALMASIGTAAIAAFACLVLVLVLRGRLPFLPASLALLAMAMLANKIYSMQYALWILPFFVLLPVPRLLMGSFFAADLVVHHFLYAYFTARAHGLDGVTESGISSLFVVFRAAALAGVVLWSLRRYREPIPAPRIVG